MCAAKHVGESCVCVCVCVCVRACVRVCAHILALLLAAHRHTDPVTVRVAVLAVLDFTSFTVLALLLLQAATTSNCTAGCTQRY